MLINYDSDGKPILTDQMLADAKEFGLHPIVVICDEQGAQVGDQCGASFAALVSFIPRQGGQITFEDNRTCEVQRVYYTVVSMNNADSKAESIVLIPNVAAYFLSESQ
ncbi:MAG: hypothetical protein ACYTBS_13170 [Planctomycetota bacterium]